MCKTSSAPSNSKYELISIFLCCFFLGVIVIMIMQESDDEGEQDRVAQSAQLLMDCIADMVSPVHLTGTSIISSKAQG